jgi:hypothetical protein
MSHSAFGTGFSTVPIYLGAIPKTMSRNKNQITSAEEFAPFKTFFQKEARGGPHVEVLYIYPCLCLSPTRIIIL